MNTETKPCQEARSAMRHVSVPQAQESLSDQLTALEYAADKLGLYDAADYLRNRRAPAPEARLSERLDEIEERMSRGVQFNFEGPEKTVAELIGMSRRLLSERGGMAR